MCYSSIIKIDSNKIKLQTFLKVIELLKVQESDKFLFFHLRLWFIMITELLKPNEFYSDMILCGGIHVDKCMFNELSWDRKFTYVYFIIINHPKNLTI